MIGNLIFFIQTNLGFICYEGSIAIDGTSLTIGELNEDNFSVYIIPHTYQKTISHHIKRVIKLI